MNTIQDAYQPPINPAKNGKRWVKIFTLSIVLMFTLGLAAYSGMRIWVEMTDPQINMYRRPVPRDYLESSRVPVRDLNPDPVPDGSGN